eukprot:gb/GFBE01010094.1/.p1 GENE.gb/GFBE01010094.1/~~gb/GFBE01010094.1/.p1  ORF type:complete len:812 (+),score=190.40 gb/GFBE01010094.1/:1-2436(+)
MSSPEAWESSEDSNRKDFRKGRTVGIQPSEAQSPTPGSVPGSPEELLVRQSARRRTTNVPLSRRDADKLLATPEDKLLATPEEGKGTPNRRLSGRARFSVVEQAKATLQALSDNPRVPKSAREVLAEVFKDADCGSSLQAWFRYFDLEQVGRIDYKEFDRALTEMSYTEGREGTLRLWQELDDDTSGEISFDEFATQREEVDKWQAFRRWSGSKFNGARDMIRQLKEHYADANGLDLPVDDVLREREFCEGLPGFGWEGGDENMFFDAFSLEEGLDRCIYPKYLRWVDKEARMFKMKQAAKRKAQKMAGLKQRNAFEAQVALKSFKAFLKKQYGIMFRAWRSVIDVDGSMTVQRTELFKAAKAINWKGDCRALWKALDHDLSGITNIEELDPRCAQLLGHFRVWAISVLGNPKKPSDIYDVLDRNKRKKLTYAQFIQELEARGFKQRTKQLVQMLDWQDKKFLLKQDLDFLDIWRAPAWLTATPDDSAAQHFRKQLVARHGHILKAWKLAMDKDGSNSCNWHEFQEAAKLVRFYGNLAGAWLALDKDLSGSISLKEIDPEAHEALVEFRQWCDAEFGSIRSAFKILDSDSSGYLSFTEFKSACKSYGFPGDCKQLFKSLDQQGEGSLAMHEVYFLDNWQIDDPTAWWDQEGTAQKSRRLAGAEGDRMLEYHTDNPGPGAYSVPTTIGCSDRLPGTRYSGGFSMGGRHPGTDSAFAKAATARRTVGPGKYNPNLRFSTPRQPAWKIAPSRPHSAKPARAADQGPLASPRTRPSTPGPGAYETAAPQKGPKYTMRPRRGLPLHPTDIPDPKYA